MLHQKRDHTSCKHCGRVVIKRFEKQYRKAKIFNVSLLDKIKNGKHKNFVVLINKVKL